MPRRAEITPRVLPADALHSSTLVSQVINRVMVGGKKSTAEQIVYSALERIGEKTGKPPVEVLEQAVKTVTPVLEVKSRRVGGANYQVPVEVPQRRARTLALRWIVARRGISAPSRDAVERLGREHQARGRTWPRQGWTALPRSRVGSGAA